MEIGAEEAGDAVFCLFEGDAEIFRQEVEVSGEEEVGFGEAAEGVSGEVEVGFYQACLTVRGIEGDVSEGGGEGKEVPLEDFAEEAVEIGEVAAQG